ncbi:type II toxin-antitoxin system HicB family antitoxin [uncultured Rhodospira sp.]|uniref:type II toxin-antitoxin system HicB family antitoxin n=1 Tax=uncultured Rhodospira sp. TaxID=1936189 RepID=UPI00262B963C|nr:type II toxin-antitoxin system HicB family antitoxin [uncultured Rhodospira sp.]
MTPHTFDGYAVTLTPDPEDGGYVVTCRDLPGLVTQGDSRDEALAMAIDAILALLSGRLDRDQPPPAPSPVRAGELWVPLSGLVAAKLAIRRAMLDQGLTQAALAARMGSPRKSLQRLLDLSHGSQWDQVEAAGAALGLRFRVVAVAA